MSTFSPARSFSLECIQINKPVDRFDAATSADQREEPSSQKTASSTELFSFLWLVSPAGPPEWSAPRCPHWRPPGRCRARRHPRRCPSLWCSRLREITRNTNTSHHGPALRSSGITSELWPPVLDCLQNLHPDLAAATISWGVGSVIILCTGISCTGGSLGTVPVSYVTETRCQRKEWQVCSNSDKVGNEKCLNAHCRVVKDVSYVGSRIF